MKLRFFFILSAFRVFLLLSQGRCETQNLSSDLGENDNFKNISETLDSSLNQTITMLQSIESLYRQTAGTIVTTNESKIRLKVNQLKSQIAQYESRLTNVSTAISLCLNQGGYLDLISDQVIQELNNCAVVALGEVVNIISDSINEAQAFMSLPTTMAQDIQTCGLGPECWPKIVSDAFYESLETPSKVLVLAARVQQFAFHSVGAVTGCALDSVGRVVDLGAEVAQEVIACAESVIN